MDDDRSEILVADIDGVVGFVHVKLFRTPAFPVFVPQLRGLVDGVYVDPAERRSGAASKLMHAAEQWATDRGAVGMDLSVYEFNASAQELFDRMGYATLSRRMVKKLP